MHQLLSLPLGQDKLSKHVQIIFVSQKVEADGRLLLTKYKNVFRCNRRRLLRWLEFLKEFNPLYHHIEINRDALATFPENDNEIVPAIYESTSVVSDLQRKDYAGENGATPEDSCLAVPPESIDEMQGSYIHQETADTVSSSIMYSRLQDALKSIDGELMMLFALNMY